MLNIDPLLFQPKVIRMSTTSSIGLPGQHIIRTTEFSNSQVMTGTATQIHNEANNNILSTNNIDTAGEFASRGRDFGSISGLRDLRNYNDMDLTTDLDQDTPDRDLSSQHSDWSAEMYWSGEGDVSDNSTLERIAQQNSASIMSFQSNLSNSTASGSFHSQLSEQSSESKEEIISSMLNKVRSHNKVEASKILLAMSNSVENCIAMRQCGVLPLLIQLLHSPDENSNTYHMMHAKRVNFEIRERASQVLHNIVFSQPDDKKGRREARVLRLLEQIRDYSDELRNLDADMDDNRNSRCVDQHLGPSVAALMKLSFDEDHRYAMCQLGGLQAIAELLQIDHEVHGCTSDQYCITIRRYSGMALTNLTFGDGANKALLCSMRPFMEALVAQLYSPSEDLRQVTASVLRNLSWRADTASKRMLREVGAVTILVKAAMEAEKESTLKSILSALWNLSAHCSANKADICQVDGALAFLVNTLTYKSKSKTLAIVENGGGILRNISSHIAIQNDYRVILRKHNCLQILLQHLKSPSLTVVSNACGTLWNLSARNAVDQRALWEMGAVGMLKKLINSKHKMISMGSSAALKNLLSAKPPGVALGLCVHNDVYKGSTEVPSLHIRKEKALSTEIDQNLSETYDNTDSPKTSPSHHSTNDKNNRTRRHISPSARYMTTQKQKNDLLSLQNRAGINEEKLTYVVEEKHNGAFQVTKNATQAPSFKQGQNRLQNAMRGDESDLSQYSSDRNTVRKNEAFKFKPAKSEGQIPLPIQQHAAPIKADSTHKYFSENMSPQMGVRKDYKDSERVTNVAQKSKCRENGEQMQHTTPKHVAETSGIPKPVHESRIPLPKSFNKLDAQRSQSASPIFQRRTIPQRQDNVPNSASHVNDTALTHPKYAWNNGYEKQDNEPERFKKDFVSQACEEPESAPKSKLYQPHISQLDDYNYGSEDEIKVYKTENTPLNFSLASSVNDLEETGVGTRCSLNIKTSTNVKLMQNHPLLSNVCNNRMEDDRLFDYRHASKDYRNFERGKTVDFSVQSDYDIDENLSIMSRSSSVASISSFDQQSFHDDESFASDLSHHTSGIESPSELTDSPCQTVPSSPQKVVCASSNLSDGQQTTLPAADVVVEDYDDDVIFEKDDATLKSNSVDSHEKRIDVDGFIRKEKVLKSQEDLSPQANAPKIIGREISEDSELDALAAKLAENFHVPENKILKTDKCRNSEEEKSKLISEEQSISERTESTEFVTCVSEFASSSSADGEIVDDLSPSERIMLEKCIRAGMPQKNSSHTQGAKQKVPQLSYQLLRDTVEKHPKACSFETDRSTTLKTLDLKENENDSHSENEEKGKEDERKAEKKRLFRIPESPIDKKPFVTQPVKSNTSPTDENVLKLNEEPTLYSMKIVVDQKGNRRCEKYGDKTKSKQNNVEFVPNQLEFLMTGKKHAPSTDSKLSSDYNKKAFDIEVSKSQNGDHSAHPEKQQIKCSAEISASNKHEKREEKFPQAREETPTSKSLETLINHDEVSAPENDKKLENFEKDIDCCEKDNNLESEESMVSSTLLCEAREIAEALLGARVDSTEDMTVSTMSCLSDIDNARPPSAMGDMGSLSMTNSTISDDNLKATVTKECQKLLGKAYNKQLSYKNSLLRELQIGRLNSEHASNDFSKGSNDSPENLSMKSSSASDLLGNVNPPSMLDEMSLTASTGSLNEMEGCDSECESEKINCPYTSKQDSMSERMHDAAAMAQLYSKELSNITGNIAVECTSNDVLSRIRPPTAMQEVMEVTVADITEIGCDTIGSDTELEDDLPCDDDDAGSETLQAPFQNSLSKDDQGEGSTENLTLTLTEEHPKAEMPPYFDFSSNNGCFMTAEELRALQENADMILNTLREAEISDEEYDEEQCGMSNGDMLDDETMSLVSNESDEEFLSPDGTHPHCQKHSPRGISQTCNGMIGLPQYNSNLPTKVRKTSLPQTSKNKSINNEMQFSENCTAKNRHSYPQSETNLKQNQCQTTNFSNFSESPKKSIPLLKSNQINNNSLSKIKVPSSNKKPYDAMCSNEAYLLHEQPRDQNEENSAFDSRTFTRKKSTVPRNVIPSIQSNPAPPSGSLRSPSSHNIPSFLGSTDTTGVRASEAPKVVTSKIAAVWKTGKARSKSMGDANRNSKLKLPNVTGNSFSKDDKFGANGDRSSSQTPSPKSPLSRSSTFEKLNEDDGNAASSARRPVSLALASQKVNSPRHVKYAQASQRAQTFAQKQVSENVIKPRVVSSKVDIQSPTSHQSMSNIPKLQNKAQPSLIPNRRSMIPTPAKYEASEN